MEVCGGVVWRCGWRYVVVCVEVCGGVVVCGGVGGMCGGVGGGMLWCGWRYVVVWMEVCGGVGGGM